VTEVAARATQDDADEKQAYGLHAQTKGMKKLRHLRYM
jgi:hypothetical protein